MEIGQHLVHLLHVAPRVSVELELKPERDYVTTLHRKMAESPVLE